MGITVWLSTFVARLMALLFLLSPGLSITGPAPAPAAPPEAQITGSAAQELKIMTFNLYYGGDGEYSPENRLPLVAETIRSEMPDSFGVQEANEFWRTRLTLELRGEYAAAGLLGRTFGFGEGTTIYYLRDKYRLVDQGMFWLSALPAVSLPAWGATQCRVAAWALLEDKETGFVYLHVNTHMDNASELARINGAALVTGFIQKMNLPAVLTGDMNCTPGKTPIEYFKQGGLTDTKDAADTAEGARTYNGFNDVDITEGEPIDYVFANGYLQSVQSYRVIYTQYDGIYPSDHFPVAAVLTLQN